MVLAHGVRYNMAKLPGIQYGSVQPLAAPDIGAPVREAAAKATLYKSIGTLALQGAELYNSIEHDKGVTAFTETAKTVSGAVDEMKQRPPTSEGPVELEGQMKDIYADATADMPKVQRDAFDKEWQDYSARKQIEFNTHNAYAMTREQRLSTKNQVMELAKVGDLETANGILDRVTMFTDAEKAELRRNVAVTTELSGYEKAMYSQDPVAIQAELNILQDEAYSGSLSASQRKTTVNWLNSAMDRATAQERAAVAHRNETMVSNLELAIEQGFPEGNPIEIENLWNAGIIKTGEKRTKLHKAYLNKQDDLTAIADGVSLVSYKLENNIPLSIENDTDAVDATFDQYVQGLVSQELPELEIMQKSLVYASRMAMQNIMPSKVKDMYNSYAMAGSPEQVMMLANHMEVLEREGQIAIQGLGIKQKAIYKSISSLYRGMPLDKAVEIARENAKVDGDKVKALGARLAAEDGGSFDRLEDLINADTDMDPTWKSAAKQSPALDGSYAALENAYYIRMDGNLEDAQAAAFSDLKTIFSRSEINGDARTMAYAPERQTGMPTEVLRKQIAEQSLPDIDPEKVTIVTDYQTAREQGIKSYQMWTRDENDILMPMKDKNGMLIRFTPNYDKWMGEREESARVEHEMAAARKKRTQARADRRMNVKSRKREKVGEGVLSDEQRKELSKGIDKITGRATGNLPYGGDGIPLHLTEEHKKAVGKRSKKQSRKKEDQRKN